MTKAGLQLFGFALTLLLIPPGISPAQDSASELASLRAKYLENLHTLSRTYTEKEEILAGKYEKSLQSLQALQTRRGDLDYVLSIKKELAHFRERTAVELVPPSLASLRKLQLSYASERNRIDAEKSSRISALIKQYGALLERTERRLTTEGKIESALLYRKEREEAQIIPPPKTEKPTAEPELFEKPEVSYGRTEGFWSRRNRPGPEDWKQHLIVTAGETHLPFPPELRNGDSSKIRLFNGAQYNSEGLNLFRGYARADQAGRMLLEACRASGEITLEVLLESYDIDQAGPARIVTFSSDAYSRNFTLGQENAELNLRLRTSETDANGMKFERSLGRIESKKLYHVLLTYSPGQLACWLNGEKVVSTDEVTGDFSNWSEQHLLFGNEHTADRPWQGRLRGITILSRAVPERMADRTAQEFRRKWRRDLPELPDLPDRREREGRREHWLDEW